MRIGASDLINDFGSSLAVAEAFILGDIDGHDQDFVGDIVDKITLEAARIRLEALGLLNPERIKQIRKDKQVGKDAKSRR